jgi:colicin import membrane protein
MRRLLLLCCVLADAPVVALAQAPGEAPGMEAELKDLNWVGFQQFQEVSRVFVRTTEPVKYRVDTSRANVVELILENTRVPLTNNTRFLDTHFFDSPVSFIQPKVIEGPSPSVRIAIRLKRQANYKAVQNDNVLALDFERQ